MKTLKNTLTILLSFLFALILLGVIFSTFSFGNKTYAETNEKNISLYLPNDNSEYFELNSPTGFTAYQEQIAVIQQDGSLFWYNGQSYVNLKDNLIVKNPHQIKFLSSDTLLISDNEILYTLDLTDLSKTAEQFKFGLEPVSGRCFDLNSNYLITISGTSIFIYRISDGILTEKKLPLQSAKDNTPVCMNENNEIFYIANDGSLKKHTIDSPDEDLTLLTNISSSTVMTANNDFVYFTELNTIKRISVDGEKLQTLNLQFDENYDIGKIVSPIDIYLFNDNLFISDYLGNTITEFTIDEENLSITYSGYAIAKGKTAYNRIGSLLLDSSKVDNSVGYLDSYKLTIITKEIDTITYKNFLQSEINYPSIFSLGKNSALLYNETQNKTYLLNTTSSIASEIDNNFDTVYDIIYFNNQFFVLASREQNIGVYKLNDGTFDNIFTKELTVNSPKFAIDNNNQIIITNIVNGESFETYKFNTEKNQETKLFETGEKALSIEIDLANQVIVASLSKVYVFNNTLSSFNLFDTQIKENISAFCFDKANGTILTSFNGDERIYLLDNKSIISIDSIKSEDFVINGKNANFDNFLTFKVSDKVLYSVNENIDTITTFDFLRSQNNGTNTFALITEVNVKLFDNSDYEFLILAGEYSLGGTITVIVPKSHTESVDVVSENIDYTKAYITTSVSMYYIPIISLSSKYCLYDNEIVRISKNESISVTKIITFLNRKFYLATYNKVTEGVTTTYSGYVPIDFTTKVLSKNIVGENFELKEVSDATVKSNLDETLYEITEKTLVKSFYDLENGKTFIAVFDGENWIKGYVETQKIVTSKNNSIKTALIIVLASASVLATSLYIVLRKKH